MYTPYEFFQAMAGLNRERVEQWRQTRYLAWAAIIAQRGAKDLPSPRDLMELPGDEKPVVNVKREDFDELFEQVRKSWM